MLFGFRGTLNLEPTLFFFILKNILVIVTQLYRLSKHMKRIQQMRMYDRLNSILTASSLSNHSKPCAMPKIICIARPVFTELSRPNAALPSALSAMISPPPDYADSREKSSNRSYEKNAAHKKFCVKKYRENKERKSADTPVTNFNYNLTYNSNSSAKTIDSEQTV